MTIVAALTGRWLASRALRPVSAVTETALRMSEQSLDRRLGLSGPDDKLHQLADAFDSMMDRLQRSFDSQRRFVSNASHELRTPLAVQRATIEVGLAGPLPDDLAETREDLLTTNREAEQLISSLLLLARSDDRGLERTEDVELTDVTEAATADLRHLAKEKGLTLRTEFDAPARISGEPVLLRHLIANLVSNALRYNRPGGRVEVTLHGKTLTVTNTGRPVDPERVEGLFEPPDGTGRPGPTLCHGDKNTLCISLRSLTALNTPAGWNEFTEQSKGTTPALSPDDVPLVRPLIPQEDFMRKNRVIGFAAAAIMTLGLTAGVASTAGALSGSGDGSGSAKPDEQSGSTAPAGKAGATHGDKPEGVAVQLTEDRVQLRKLTEEELQNSDGAKPTKLSVEAGAVGGGNPESNPRTGLSISRGG